MIFQESVYLCVCVCERENNILKVIEQQMLQNPEKWKRTSTREGGMTHLQNSN